MGCDVSSQTVRPDISDGTGLQNRVLQSHHDEKVPTSSLGGDAQNYDILSTHGLTNDVTNMLSRPDKGITAVVYEGNVATNSSIESHHTDSTGLLYCDAARIMNPQNMIAATKRGDTEAVKALCHGTARENFSAINSLGMCSLDDCNTSLRLMAISYAYA